MKYGLNQYMLSPIYRNTLFIYCSHYLIASLDSKSHPIVFHANNGAIAGGIIGTLAIIVIILAGAVGVVWFLKRRIQKKEAYELFG